jgi:hypothetical protein
MVAKPNRTKFLKNISSPDLMLVGLNLPDSPDAAKPYTMTRVDSEADGAVSVK